MTFEAKMRLHNMHPARVFPYLTLLISTSAATTSATPAADCHNTCQSITSAFPKVPAKVCDTLCAPDGLACATVIQAWQGTAKAKTAISASEVRFISAFIFACKTAL